MGGVVDVGLKGIAVLILAAVTAEAVPSTSIAVPPWVEKLSIFGAVVLLGVALSRGWLYTSGQVSRMEETWKEVARHWEEIAKERGQTIKDLTAGLEPVAAGQEAILRAVQERQDGRSTSPRGRTR